MKVRSNWTIQMIFSLGLFKDVGKTKKTKRKTKANKHKDKLLSQVPLFCLFIFHKAPYLHVPSICMY